MVEDQILHCRECGISFLWAVEEQASHTPAPECCPMCERLAPPAGQRRGTIKWFSPHKGYGFITARDGQEIFVHRSGLVSDQPPPQAGQLVQFLVTEGSRGQQAEAVRAVVWPATGSERREGP
jgi:cold shock protein